MSAFSRPSPENLPVEAQLRWWRSEMDRRRALRCERLQRGRLSPHLAALDDRMERAVAFSLAELLRRTAIAEVVDHKATHGE